VKLRKKDITPIDDLEQKIKEGAADRAGSAVQLLLRLRNNLQIRCVHHTDHFKYPFGEDAENMSHEEGVTCRWCGDFAAYEEHIRKGCPIENHLSGRQALESEYAAPVSDYGRSGHANHHATASQSNGDKGKNSPMKGKGGGRGSKGRSEAATPTPLYKEALAGDGSEIRVCRYDYIPRETDKAQIPLRTDDLVRIFETTPSGWSAGVRLNRDTMLEMGDAGWFPAEYLVPLPGQQ